MDWALAGVIVGSIATICLTILKILEMGQDKKIKPDDHMHECTKANCTDLEVLKAEVANLKEDLDHVHTHFDTLNESIIKLLTENYKED